MDKATVEELLDAAGNPIKASTTFVANQKNGQVEVVKTFTPSNFFCEKGWGVI